MKKFLLYGHGGSYNHGAEAITVSTIRMIRQKHLDAHIALVSHFPSQDHTFAIDADAIFSPDPKTWDAEKLAKSLDEKKKFAAEMYRFALDYIASDVICIAVGGDNFCYPNWYRWSLFQERATRENAKSLLWGCSIEPSMITDEMVWVLGSYTWVLVRESLTFAALQDRGLGRTIRLVPDVAFRLEPNPSPLPKDFFHKRLVGLNFGPLILRREAVPGVLGQNIRCVVDYILSETDANIALIPHVVMPMDNDYKVLSALWAELPLSCRSRVCLIPHDLSAAAYKSVIAQCELLICARTHASIAAYSSGVPALVIGYSVKSLGIAKDLGMQDYVIHIDNITARNTLTNIFAPMYAQKEVLRSRLNARMADYIKETDNYSQYI